MEGEGLWGGQQSGSGGAWRTGDGNGNDSRPCSMMLSSLQICRLSSAVLYIM